MVQSTKIPGSCLHMDKSLLNSFRCCFTNPTGHMASRSDVPSTNRPTTKRKEHSFDGRRCKDIYLTSDQAHVRSNQACNFQDLPFDCKLSIFSYLTTQDRGRVGLVCMEWNVIARTPSLWSDVDLTKFSFLCDSSCQQGTSYACHKSYKDRIEKYLDHVLRIRPTVRRLCFAFDIADSQDMWLSVLNRFLSSARMQDLKVAELNWKETPAKSFPSPCERVTRSTTYSCNDLRYQRRRRQRQFAAFFDQFTASTTKVTIMALPFDWSATSICALGRLTCLEMLELDSYFVPQPKFEQNLLDKVLTSLPRLKYLTMAVCLGIGAEISTFSMASRTLEYLNLTGCAGLCIVKVNLPNLRELWVNLISGHTLIANDLCYTSTRMPCLYKVLCVGSPNLHCINGHSLHKDWRINRNNELENVLMRICPCVDHKSISVAALQHIL